MHCIRRFLTYLNYFIRIRIGLNGQVDIYTELCGVDWFGKWSRISFTTSNTYFQ